MSADTQVTDLSADDHACLTFGEHEELLDLTAAFVRDGLAAGLRVVLADDSPPLAVARLDGRGVPAGQAAGAGQLIAAGWEDALAGPGGFSAGQAMAWLRGLLARRDGWPGLRVAVDMGWALRPVTGVEELPGFEEQIAAQAAGGGLSVLCGYDRERFDPVTLASVLPWHSRSVAAATYHADPVLRICRQYVPPGIRLAGELDYQAREPLAAVLADPPAGQLQRKDAHVHCASRPAKKSQNTTSPKLAVRRWGARLKTKVEITGLSAILQVRIQDRVLATPQANLRDTLHLHAWLVRIAARKSSGSGRSPAVPVIRHHRLRVGAGLHVVGWVGGWRSWTPVFICR